MFDNGGFYGFGLVLHQLLYRLEYIGIVFSFVYQIWLFDDIPDTYEIIGAVLVIIACSLSVLEELYNHYYKQEESPYDYYEGIPDPDSPDVETEDPSV